jgi:hypothetical protein
MLQRVLGVATALALMAPVGLIAAQPAGAAAGTTCKTTTGTATIKPGLGKTKTNQTITAVTNLSACSGAVKTGKGTASIKIVQGNCADLAKTGLTMKLTETVKWNTGRTSVLTGTSKTGPNVGQAMITAKVTKGLYVRLNVTTVVAFTPKKGSGCSDAKRLTTMTIKGVKPFVIK